MAGMLHGHRAWWRAAVLAATLGLGGLSQAQDSIITLSPPVEAPPASACGNRPLAIARMAWPSAELLAEIHARVLTEAFDCAVQVVPGDLAATAASMAASGQPAIAPEMWASRIAEAWNAGTKARSIRQAGPSFDLAGLEGWFVPDYVAADQPAITSARSLGENWQSLAGADGKVRLISCPADWACSVINRNLIAALGLAEHVEIVEPADRFELDTVIAGAISRREPIVLYYWQPNGLLSQFSVKALDMGAYDRDAFFCLAQRDCADPRPSAFPPEPVVIATSEWVFTDLPEIAAYLSRAAMPIAEMDRLLALLANDGVSVQTVAEGFVRDRRDVWQAWVGPATP